MSTIADKTLVLKIAGVNLKITTNYGNYYNYLKAAFRKVMPRNDYAAGADIQIEVCWENFSPKQYLNRLKQTGTFQEIGGATFLAENRVVFLKKIAKRKKVIFDVKVDGNKFYLKTLVTRKAFRDALRYGILGKLEEELFFTITYPLVYYPLLWYLERFRQIHSLHAAGIEVKNNAIVICGREGIGKTSLSLSLLSEPGAGFISDNLILYDREKIYPCYELVRIHKNETESLWKGKFEKVIEFRMFKDFYEPVSPASEEGEKPEIFIFPQFSSQFLIEEVTPEHAVQRALTLSYLPSELKDYCEYRNLYNLLNLDFNPWQSQYDSLKTLLRSARCYVVNMPKAAGLAENYQKLRLFINKWLRI